MSEKSPTPRLWYILTVHPDPTPARARFSQFPLPTQMIVGEWGPAYPRTAGEQRYGREYETPYKERPDGKVEHWREHNDGRGTDIVLQEVFVDGGDDGHVLFEHVGWRYVPRGTPPWWCAHCRENDGQCHFCGGRLGGGS